MARVTSVSNVPVNSTLTIPFNVEMAGIAQCVCRASYRTFCRTAYLIQHSVKETVQINDVTATALFLFIFSFQLALRCDSCGLGNLKISGSYFVLFWFHANMLLLFLFFLVNIFQNFGFNLAMHNLKNILISVVIESNLGKIMYYHDLTGFT
ncbi:hypothetical protein T12_8647 [Trichinella patagoniensis]|uniref:Uncharacterized protein n=1 Tax=Trichinella patagoniensis TaxID=990121 RepID=A0A0V1AGC9_9BILA|nr:hypothetical protein T12_8647 [Trichinella patagoniensis]